MVNELMIFRDEMVTHNMEMESRMSIGRQPLMMISSMVGPLVEPEEIRQRQDLGTEVLGEEDVVRTHILGKAIGQHRMRTWIHGLRTTAANWIHSTHESIKRIDRSIRSQRRRARKPVSISIYSDEPPPPPYSSIDLRQ